MNPPLLLLFHKQTALDLIEVMKSFLIVALFCVANVFGFRAVSTRFSKNTLKLSLADVSNVLIESNFNLAGGTLVLGTICGALGNRIKSNRTLKHVLIL